MPDAFKNLINARTVADAAAHLQAAWPAFDRRRFERLAGKGLDGLEMKARAMQIAEALDTCLPADFAQAAAIVEAALAPAGGHGVSGNATDGAGLGGWVVWSLGVWAADAARTE
jgi:hypothetical protein